MRSRTPGTHVRLSSRKNWRRFSERVIHTCDEPGAEQVTTAQRGEWACDSGQRDSDPAGLVIRRNGSPALPAWLTFDVRQKMKTLYSQYASTEKRSRPIDTAFLALGGAMCSGTTVAGLWGAWAAFSVASLRVGAGKILPLIGCAAMIAVTAIAARLSWTLFRKMRRLWL